MKKSLNDAIAIYKKQLAQGEIQFAYKSLLKNMMSLKAHFSKELKKYSLGNVSPGYMDFTYFPFFDAFLRTKKLRFGIVLNHHEMRFELWLMGQNETIQAEYWHLLKNTKWNKNKSRPRYSVLESILVENPDFNNLDVLNKEITHNAAITAQEVIDYIKTK